MESKRARVVKIEKEIYITTDEEIKEGDWVFGIANGEYIIVQHKVSEDYQYTLGKKIITTTDTELKIYESETLASASGFNLKTNSISLPQPSQAFIEKYCKVGGGIDEVLVEYVEKDNKDIQKELGVFGHDEGLLQSEYDEYIKNNSLLKLKVDSHNTITIHPIKDSWNREEVEILLKRFIQFYRDRPVQSKILNGVGKWIEENL